MFGAKHSTECVVQHHFVYKIVLEVGERFKCSEAYDVSRSGALGGENARMSNRKWGENPHRRKPKVSSAMSITGGLGAPKDNPAPFLLN